MPVVDGTRGRAFDLRDRDLDASEFAAAIRAGRTTSRGDSAAAGHEAAATTSGEDDAAVGAAVGADDDAAAVGASDSMQSDEGEALPTIRCASPGPVHHRVGVVRADRTYPLLAALAEAARALGYESERAEELRAVRERLAALEPPEVSLTPARRAVAATDDATALEERVATLRGQLELARERGEDPDELEAATERAIAELAERRTERIAAEQSLERARERARERRDRREERLRLQDREKNLQRAVRRDLARRVAGSFDRALRALADATAPQDRPWQVEDQVAGALAVCRIAPLAAPVVVAVDRFRDARHAAAALDAPVVLVSQ